MTDTSSWKKELWRAIKEEAEKEDRKRKLPDEKTVRDFVQETGMSFSRAKNFLDKLVVEGKLAKRVAWIDECRAVVALYTPLDDIIRRTD